MIAVPSTLFISWFKDQKNTFSHINDDLEEQFYINPEGSVTMSWGEGNITFLVNRTELIELGKHFIKKKNIHTRMNKTFRFNFIKKLAGGVFNLPLRLLS